MTIGRCQAEPAPSWQSLSLPSSAASSGGSARRPGRCPWPGNVALLGALGHALPRRLALSAAFLLLHAVYLVLVLVHPLVTSGPLRPGAALAILAAPCLAVVPDVVLRRRARDRPDSPRSRMPSLLLLGCATVGGLVMIAAAVAAGRDDPFGFVAWSSSGDARFHLLFVRDVRAEGGLHGRPFTHQPQYQEALTGLLVDTHGREALQPGPRLEADDRLATESWHRWLDSYDVGAGTVRSSPS